MMSLFRCAHILCPFGVSLGALIIAASCASGVQISPPLIEECGGEEACEPDCFVDMDCSEGERCVEGRCYENECVSGESRPCEAECGRGSQQCIGGIWRGCSTSISTPECELVAAREAGEEAGGEAGEEAAGEAAGVQAGLEGGEGAGVQAGLEGGEPVGGEGEPDCDPSWTELCSDSVDQDCDGLIDEGCGACIGLAEEPVVNPANARSRFSDSGVVTLGRVGTNRKALLSRSTLNYQPILYALGSRGELDFGSEVDVEAGLARAIFSSGAKVGVLQKTTEGLRLRRLESSGLTEQSVQVTSAESVDEVIFNDNERVNVSWTEGNDVHLRSFDLMTLSPEGPETRVSDAPFRSAKSALTQSAQGLTVAFEDERNQGPHPEVYLALVEANGLSVTARAHGVGYDPKLLWTNGTLYLASRRVELGRHQVYLAQLDPRTLEELGPPRLVYETSEELSLHSLTGSSSEELTLIFTERDPESIGVPLYHAKVLYVSPSRRPSKGPFLAYSIPAQLRASDLLYEAEREELIIGWVSTGSLDGFIFQRMELVRVQLGGPIACDTAN